MKTAALVLLLGLTAPGAAWTRERPLMRARYDGPGIGEKAPDFELKMLPDPGNPPAEETPEGGTAASPRTPSGEAPEDSPQPATVRLSDFKGKDYVVLLFSSYT